MLYREIIAVFSQIHTKHTNTLCGQNVELLNIKLDCTVQVKSGAWNVSLPQLQLLDKVYCQIVPHVPSGNKHFFVTVVMTPGSCLTFSHVSGPQA